MEDRSQFVPGLNRKSLPEISQPFIDRTEARNPRRLAYPEGYISTHHGIWFPAGSALQLAGVGPVLACQEIPNCLSAIDDPVVSLSRD
jgi:hypothetical protein